MKYLSLCSGIEAATVAWKHLRWDPVGFAEIEPFPSAVLAHHYPNITNYGDITKHEQWGIEPGTVDLICGGPPCQSFSIAGKREGMSDTRGSLSITYVELVQRIKPRWIVYENVPGLLSADNGTAFAKFLQNLVNIGFCCAWRVIDPAQSFGRNRLPQRRRRVFVVGYFGNWEPAAKVLFKPEGSQGCSYEIKSKGEEDSTNPGNGAGGCCEPITFQPGNLRRNAGADPSHLNTTTLKATMGDQFPHIAYCASVSPAVSCGALVCSNPDFRIRRLTVNECLRLQGFPDHYTTIPWRGKPAELCPDGPQYKAIGNSWAVPVARWIGERIDAFERGAL